MRDVISLPLLYAILAVTVISLLSLVGILALSLSEDTLDRFLFFVLSFSAGSIIGAALLDLLPEAVELVGESFVFIYVTFGYVTFFFLERSVSGFMDIYMDMSLNLSWIGEWP